MPASIQLQRRLDVLKTRVEEALGLIASARAPADPHRNYYDPLDANPWFERWRDIHQELVATDDELAGLPAPTRPAPTSSSDNDGRGYFARSEIKRLRNEICDAWDILNHPTRQLPQVTLDREGIFVARQPFDAMLAITSILRNASSEIVVIDQYVSEETLRLLAVKAVSVSAKILTGAADTSLITHARAFNAQHSAGPALEIRTSRAFHDRFVLLDRKDYYHFGHSLKDAAKRNAFMFSRIEEPTVMSTLATAFATEWSAAPVVQL